MSVYLQDIPLDQALGRFQDALTSAGLWGPLGVESIPLDENALGRVLAGPAWARISSPHYHASAMDGFAVRSTDTEGAMPTAPRVLAAGEAAQYVDTGDVLPDWADAVIPIENIEPLDADGRVAGDLRHPAAIRIRAGAAPWSAVRPMGEDIVATQLVLPGGQVLRPVDLGALAASGAATVEVFRTPRVAVIPTGDELVPVGKPPEAGEIIEMNSIVLAAQVRSWGGAARRYPITRDVFADLCGTVSAAAQENDLILLNAGSSAGSEDFSARVVQELGTLLVHGVAVRPGHPVILGMIRRKGEGSKPEVQVPIVGVPGYPVSAALTGEIFILPLLARWQGKAAAEAPVVEAELTRKITSPAGDDDYLRVAVGRVGARTLAAPLARGAGVITSLVRADGLVVIPRGTQGLEAGSRVRVHLYTPPAELDRTIFAVGSHDLTLDVLAQFMAAKGRRLVSANVGSLGGLVAIRRGEAHLGGCHLLDPSTGEYNLAAIREYLPGAPVKLMHWVGRTQGLLVRPGNPKKITTLADLIRPDVSFVNRQRGAGTRVLLDYHLQRLGFAPESVRGYNHEEYTHLAVAAAVKSGRADCGLGITAAAQALGLDFIPLFDEQYDLVITADAAQSRLLEPLFELAADPAFRAEVSRMPGYDTSRMGAFSELE